MYNSNERGTSPQRVTHYFSSIIQLHYKNRCFDKLFIIYDKLEINELNYNFL